MLKQTELEKKLGRVAIVCDQMTGFGGADRELISILKILPNADIFTILYFKEKFKDITNTVNTSFVQKLPFKKFLSTHLKVFTPLAYEAMDFSNYDYVISISAGPAKGVITPIETPHIAMTMTPPRTLWDKERSTDGGWLRKIYNPVAQLANTYFRIWDHTISKRVDYWTANSKYVQSKIKKIYDKDAQVIYPGVGEKWFEEQTEMQLKKVRLKYNLPKHFTLIVSRLYDHKRIDWAIEACKKTNTPLYIVGEGPDRRHLEKLVTQKDNIHFLGRLSDTDVITLYNLSDLLLFCSIEDFGLVPVEAMASGTPVFAYNVGGVRETVAEGVTGEFFSTIDELTELLKKFDVKRYNRGVIKKQALKFSEENFHKELIIFLNKVHEKESSRP